MCTRSVITRRHICWDFSIHSSFKVIRQRRSILYLYHLQKCQHYQPLLWQWLLMVNPSTMKCCPHQFTTVRLDTACQGTRPLQATVYQGWQADLDAPVQPVWWVRVDGPQCLQCPAVPPPAVKEDWSGSVSSRASWSLQFACFMHLPCSSLHHSPKPSLTFSIQPKKVIKLLLSFYMYCQTGNFRDLKTWSLVIGVAKLSDP